MDGAGVGGVGGNSEAPATATWTLERPWESEAANGEAFTIGLGRREADLRRVSST
jgi:hypothetical protein